MATHPARTRERTVRFGRRAPFRGSSAAERPAVNRDVAGSNPALGAEGPCRSPARSPSSRDGESGAAPLTGMRSRRVDGTPSSKRPLAGSNPAERSFSGPRGPIGTDAALRTRRQEVRILSGVHHVHASSRHLVSLPGCLPGEAGSIPVGGAKERPSPRPGSPTEEAARSDRA